MPQISVIVPVYKVEKYIHRCVDSILSQTFSDFELVLVDDGSPDNCGAICDAYAAKDPRVKVIHQQNGGLSAARNAGIDWVFANSDSRWLTFVDSDDWIHPKMLESLLTAAEQHASPVSICGYAETEGDEPETADDVAVVLWDTEQFFVEHNVNATIACGKLYRRECFTEIRYPVGKIHEDEFTTYRILFQQECVPVISESLYCYRVNNTGITKSKWTPRRLVYFDAAKSQAAFFEEIGKQNAKKRVMRLYLWGLLGQHALYLQDGPCSRKIDRAFQKLAWYYVLHYGRENRVDQERKLHLLWMMFPRLSQIYHGMKEKLR